MKKQSGHNWACHNDESKLCSGFVDHLQHYYPELNPLVGELISYTTWYNLGDIEAMNTAGEHLKMPKVINIDFRSSVPIESKLSNFNSYQFTIDGVECASMEGFIQSLKTDDIHVQRQLCTMVGRVAKRAGRLLPDWRPNQTLYWNGVTYNRHSEGYINLVTRAYSLLANQNEEFRTLLISTGESTLTHKVGSQIMNETVLTEREFCDILIGIRSQYLYQSSMEF